MNHQTFENSENSLNSDGNSEEDQKSRTPSPEQLPAHSRGRPQGSRNRTDSWKNTSETPWKPSISVKLKTDPDSIVSRTPLWHNKDVVPLRGRRG